MEEFGKTVGESVTIPNGQLEEKAKMTIQGEDQVMQWMVRWSAMMVSSFLVGHDGKTGSERRRGRKCNMPAFAFDEKVWFRRIRDNKNIKLGVNVDMQEGIWLGHAR